MRKVTIVVPVLITSLPCVGKAEERASDRPDDDAKNGEDEDPGAPDLARNHPCYIAK